MTFIFRLTGAVIEGVFIVIVVAIIILFLTWALNRGLQLFASLLGYEVGDFFGWLMAKFHIEKKAK